MPEGDVEIKISGGQRLRDAAGRWRRFDPGSDLDRLVTAWADVAVAELREATPVEEVEEPDMPLQRWHAAPGTARNAWRWDHLPSVPGVKITNTAVDQKGVPYLRFHVTGTPEADPGMPIFPHTAPMLIFYAKEGEKAGQKIGRPWVWGIEPNPHLVAAIERLGPAASTLFERAGIKILQDIAEIIRGG